MNLKANLKRFPVVHRITADILTPIAIWLKIHNHTPSFLLESVVNATHLGRYSFIGTDIRKLFVLNEHQIETIDLQNDTRTQQSIPVEDPLKYLRDYMNAHPWQGVEGLPLFPGGLAGYAGFESIRYFEPVLEKSLLSMPEENRAANPYPESIFMTVDTLIVFDHAYGQIQLISNYLAEKKDDAREQEVLGRLKELETTIKESSLSESDNGDKFKEVFQSNTSRETYHQIVETAKSYIRAGDIFQVVPSQRLQKSLHADPFDIYRTLRQLNPSPYMFFLDFQELINGKPFQIIGASPETHVRLENRTAILRPIAGTRPRGKTADQDAAFETELLADPKERAEHIMLVDLARNDLGRVCEYGTVKPVDLMVIEKYSHVMHIVSQVEGRLKDNYDGFDLLAATFPAGTVSGAPKIRAIEIIQELEKQPRGPYGGVVGYFAYNGNMDTCITLRTLTRFDQEIRIQAGGGVVADSQPESEYQETLRKAEALTKAVLITENGGLYDSGN